MIKGVSFCQTRSYDMHVVLRKTATEDKNEVGKREVMRGGSRRIRNRKRGGRGTGVSSKINPKAGIGGPR